MVTMDTRLPLMIQQPNVLAALDAGTTAAANQSALMRQAEGQNIFRQHGAAAMRGDQNALAAIGAFDPMMGQEMQSNQLSMDLTRERIADIRRQAAEAARAQTDQAALRAELAQGKQARALMLRGLATQDQELFRQGAAEFDMPDLEMNEQSVIAVSAMLAGIDDSLALPTEGLFPAGPEYGVSNGHFYDKNNPAAGAQPIPGMPISGQETSVQLADGTTMRIGPAGSAGSDGGAVDLSSPGAFIDKIDATLNDPALDWSTGALAWTQHVPGSPMKRFQTRARQLSGTAFMQARDALKGGGQITDFEGKRAEDAIARLDTAQHPNDYRDALLELRGILIKGMQRERGWIDTRAGQIMNMSAGDIDALDLSTLSREELAAARERLMQLATIEGE